MNRLSIILIIFVFLISGCSSKKRVVVAKKELPAWYIHPPKSNNAELFALGEGENQREAIDNALSLVISTLHVSLSSSFSSKTVVKEGSINSSDATYINLTKSNIKKIDISEYTILHEKQLGFKRYAAVVKVNKQKMFEGLKNEIEQRFTIYKNDIKSIEKLDALQQLNYYKKIKGSFEYIKNALIIMKVIHEDFDDKKYIALINEVNTKYLYLLKHISFWVNSNVENLEKPVISALTKRRFAIKKGVSKLHYDVFVNAKIQQVNAYGFALARSEITFVTKNYRGKIIASNIVHVTGQSSQGYEIAKQNLVKKLNNFIQKEGIFTVLNI